jgi:small subunit ribosomal protein S6
MNDTDAVSTAPDTGPDPALAGVVPVAEPVPVAEFKPPAPGMRRYETTVIAVPTLTEEEQNQLVAGLEQVIADAGGQLIRTDRWGKRRLAYRVRKQEDGFYFLFFYESPSSVVRELERRIRIDDRLIKFLSVLVDWEERVLKAEAARALRLKNAPPRPAGRMLDDDDSGDDDYSPRSRRG